MNVHTKSWLANLILARVIQPDLLRFKRLKKTHHANTGMLRTCLSHQYPSFGTLFDNSKRKSCPHIRHESIRWGGGVGNWPHSFGTRWRCGQLQVPAAFSTAKGETGAHYIRG